MRSAQLGLPQPRDGGKATATSARGESTKPTTSSSSNSPSKTIPPDNAASGPLRPDYSIMDSPSPPPPSRSPPAPGAAPGERPARPAATSDTRIERRRKMRKVTRACDACKFRKRACTGNLPCGPCVRRKVDCTYNTTYHRGVAVSPPPSDAALQLHQHQHQHQNRQQNHALCSIAVSTPTSREELDVPPVEGFSTGRQPQQQENEVTEQYWGPTSAHSFLGRAVLDLPTTPSNVIANGEDRSRSSATSIFLYGDRVAPDVSVDDFKWPDRSTAESLIRRYFEFASPTYRSLHQPTVEAIVHRLYECDVRNEDRGASTARFRDTPAAARAIVLLAFSTATLFQPDTDGRMRDADDRAWRVSELYYVKADHLLSQETGAPSLESAQARFLMVLYLVSSSRAHKAWYTLGTTIQLIMALGFHSRRPRRDLHGVDLIQRECQRRIVWCSYTLDKYLSVILGRPRLWHDEDLDVELPVRVNDHELSSTAIEPSKRDCMMDAPVFHAILARTLAMAAKEPYVVSGISSREEINTIQALCGRVVEWQAELPPFLSGIIHPSSLIPSFQRQLTVLQLARYHILMFITRPLLLRNYGQIWPDCEPRYLHYLSVCLTAARDAIELILTFVRDNQLFHAFWYSQYITFNALSIIYIYLIQVQRGRILPISRSYAAATTPDTQHASPLDEAMLYRLSESAQYHLADATVRNAPSWKYSAILQGLRRELERLGLGVHAGESPGHEPGVDVEQRDTSVQQNGHEYEHRPGSGSSRDIRGMETMENDALSYPLQQQYLVDPRTESLFDYFALDKDLMLDFWPQLDTLPITFPFN